MYGRQVPSTKETYVDACLITGTRMEDEKVNIPKPERLLSGLFPEVHQIIGAARENTGNVHPSEIEKIAEER